MTCLVGCKLQGSGSRKCIFVSIEPFKNDDEQTLITTKKMVVKVQAHRRWKGDDGDFLTMGG